MIETTAFALITIGLGVAVTYLIFLAIVFKQGYENSTEGERMIAISPLLICLLPFIILYFVWDTWGREYAQKHIVPKWKEFWKISPLFRLQLFIIDKFFKHKEITIYEIEAYRKDL